MLRNLENAFTPLISYFTDRTPFEATPEAPANSSATAVDSYSEVFTISGQRIEITNLKPRDREAATLLHYGCCDVAYEIDLYDPQLKYSIGLWNKRIEEIRYHIAAEHYRGHPTYSLKHDGTLKTRDCRNRSQ